MSGRMESPEQVYKIVTRDAFAAAEAEGRFPRMPIDDTDGYIHFSTAAQLPDTLRLHFAGQGDLVVFAVRLADFEGLRWEPSRNGQLFPHAYGEMSASAIGRQAVVSVAADGGVDLPAWIR